MDIIDLVIFQGFFQRPVGHSKRNTFFPLRNRISFINIKQIKILHQFLLIRFNTLNNFIRFDIIVNNKCDISRCRREFRNGTGGFRVRNGLNQPVKVKFKDKCLLLQIVVVNYRWVNLAHKADGFIFIDNPRRMSGSCIETRFGRHSREHGVYDPDIF